MSLFIVYLPQLTNCFAWKLPFYYFMKKTTAFSSLLLLGSLGSLSYLAAQLAALNLTFDLRDEDAAHYC